MANNVFANNNELACKAGNGKSICCFPDVCMTPPENPATPPGVPVPYPNTGLASDTTNGSRSVLISEKEVMIKDKSCFKKSIGDEAGAAAKKGVVTSVNRGEVYFASWSMDVKIEGENVDRHLDLTIHNEACNPPNAATMAFVDASAFGESSSCKKKGGNKQQMEKACDGEDPCPGILNIPVEAQKIEVAKKAANRDALFSSFATVIKDAMDAEIAAGRTGSRTARAGAATEAEAKKSKCAQAARCYLRPYKPKKDQDGCCPGQTPHHIPPKACFDGLSSYDVNSALCVCMEGMSQHVGSHGKNHAAIDYLATKKGFKKNGTCDLNDYNRLCCAAVAQQAGCDQKCLEEQLANNPGVPKSIKNIEHRPSNSNVSLDNNQKASLCKQANLPVDVPKRR
jgi:hypothetical protein